MPRATRGAKENSQNRGGKWSHGRRCQLTAEALRRNLTPHWSIDLPTVPIQENAVAELAVALGSFVVRRDARSVPYQRSERMREGSTGNP
jgi:hypothetical protein